jgi:uncharacterized membrane protein
MTSTNFQLRAKARALLGGKIFETNWLMALVVLLIVGAIYGAASSFFVAGIIVYGPLYIGSSYVFLKLVRTGKAIKLEDTFTGFNDFGNNLLLGFMQMLFISLWSLLFVIPGIIMTYAYSMSFYIKNDHPEYTWKECLKESKAMMKGNKWKLFCLDFSFIGWILLSFLTLGLGMLWVSPYMTAAKASFYNELKGEEIPFEFEPEEAPVEEPCTADVSEMAIPTEEAPADETAKSE